MPTYRSLVETYREDLTKKSQGRIAPPASTDEAISAESKQRVAEIINKLPQLPLKKVDVAEVHLRNRDTKT